MGVCLTLSRFSAPRVASRSRSGRATTDWKPTLRAAVENGGQRIRPAGSRVRQASRRGRRQDRAFLGLQLEQLQRAHRLAGGGHQPQAALRRDQHHADSRDIEQGHAPVREPG